MYKRNLFQFIMAFVFLLSLSGCNGGNGVSPNTVSNSVSPLQDYINSLAYTAKSTKQLTTTGTNQQSFTTPGGLIINSVDINFYSGADCNESLIFTKTLNGDPLHPVMPANGTYTSTNKSNNKLCSDYVNGTKGCAVLYSNLSTAGLRSMQYVYNIDDGDGGSYPVISQCLYNQEAVIGSSNGVEGIANWTNVTTATACSGSGDETCGFSQPYNVILTPPVEYVAVGTGGTIVYSRDGSSWESVTIGSQYFNGVTYGDHQFVAVGEAGILYSSRDGINWVSQVSNTVQELFEIIYGNSLFVSVGCEGTIITSPNAVNWTTQTSATGCDVYGVTYGAGLYVATGQSGIIQTSPDGANWTLQTSPTSNELTAVNYGNGKYLAVGDGGTIVYSSDASSWTLANSPITAQIGAVTYANGLYVAVARDGGIITSADAESWTIQTSPTTTPLYGVTYKGKFLVVGNDGIILSSLNGINWSIESSPTTANLWGITSRR